MKEKVLILYHSGAGSTKFTSKIVAEKLRGVFDVTIFSIGDITDYNITSKYDLLIFGFPTYHCEPSTSILEFIRNIRTINKNTTAFFFTCYTLYTGNCLRIFYNTLREKNINVLGFSQFRSPASDGVLLFPSSIRFMFNFEKNYIKKVTHFCKKIINYKSISPNKKPCYKWYVPLNELAKIYAKKDYDRMKANMRIINNRCTNCNLCVKVCERKCFTPGTNTPDLDTKNCEFCLACIHKCPKKAIIFSQNMALKPRLNHSFYKKKKMTMTKW